MNAKAKEIWRTPSVTVTTADESFAVMEEYVRLLNQIWKYLPETHGPAFLCALGHVSANMLAVAEPIEKREQLYIWFRRTLDEAYRRLLKKEKASRCNEHES